MDLVIGVDVGTSGIRAVCTDSSMIVHSTASTQFKDFNGLRTDPAIWAEAVVCVLSRIINSVPCKNIKAIAVDGTSGTMLVSDDQSRPLSQAIMYNSACDDDTILSAIKESAPETSAAHGVSSGLARAIVLSRIPGAACILHEADWVSSGLSGQTGISDENNALKTGYDPISRSWPDWIDRTGMNRAFLPQVFRAGQPIGPAMGWLAKKSGLPESVLVVAGTTDGCASFLATGASEAGEGVSVLGSTLTIKLLSDKPVYAPQYGIYSHRIGDTWLAGGASNTGGRVLERYFSPEKMQELSEKMNTSTKTQLTFYPLLEAGERFPINDPLLLPVLEPRPDSDTLFLQGMLEGISAIENLAYSRLHELGAPLARTIRTVGGGAKNASWNNIRRQELNTMEFLDSASEHAAAGSAVLALRGAQEAGVVD